MRARIVRIGNSRGLRLPKALLNECGIEDAVELSVEDGKLVVAAARSSRAGWEEAAREMVEHGDDQLLDPSVPTRFDAEAWVW